MELTGIKQIRPHLYRLITSTGVRDGVLTSAAMTFAGGLDYLVNVLAGRWLVPLEYGIFIGVAALLQILLYGTNVIRNVMAFYVAEIYVRPEAVGELDSFVRRAWRWSWRWGLSAAAFMVLLSPLLARSLRFPSAPPLWAASFALLLFFVRSITDGTLQGTQSFVGFSSVQVLQSALRVVFMAALVLAGWQSFGAILALPLACSTALLLALWFLRDTFRSKAAGPSRPVSWRYSGYTMLGFSSLAMLTNMDPLFVRHFYGPYVAGNYGPVVTVAKANLFIPLAIAVVLFPKATQRQAGGRDPRPILLMAQAAALGPALLLVFFDFLFPGWIVRTLFGPAYANPGMLLGLASLAATLYACLAIWLNYALSLERTAFVSAMAGIVVFQFATMLLIGKHNLISMLLAMIAAGAIGNIGAIVLTWSGSHSRAAAATLESGRA